MSAAKIYKDGARTWGPELKGEVGWLGLYSLEHRGDLIEYIMVLLCLTGLICWDSAGKFFSKTAGDLQQVQVLLLVSVGAAWSHHLQQDQAEQRGFEQNAAEPTLRNCSNWMKNAGISKQVLFTTTCMSGRLRLNHQMWAPSFRFAAYILELLDFSSFHLLPN